MNELSCEIVQDLLPSYTDGLTNPVTDRAIREHLDACPACRESFERMTRPASAEPDPAEEKELDFLKKTRRNTRRKILTAFGAALVVLGGIAALVWLWMYNNTVVSLSNDRILLPVPLVCGTDGGLTCARQTTVTYPQRGSSIGQITDVFTAFNSSDHTQDYLVVYPDCVTWLNKYHSGEIKIECTVLINGEVCNQYWALQGQEVETSQGRQRLEDGTYFSAVFPEAPLSLPEEGRNGSFRGLRYFAAPVTLAAGEELRIEVRFTQLQMTTYVFFRPIYGQMTCLSHTLRLENTETMHIMQNVTDTTIDSTVEVSLDPTREDYYIRATRYRFRYQ